jgi:acyl-[acyl-carrier-protein]-phospholipid O-acyltransferase/long-chain-fatty-acid--[acyl-carrier-protein] ligase
MVPYPLAVAFGKPMPPTASASEVRSAVQKLAADCAVARTERCRAVHREFVRTAVRRPLRRCVIEQASDMSAAKTYRYSVVLTRAACLAHQLKRRINESEIIGIWLPPGFDAVTAHIAIAFCGKAVVHLAAQDDPKRTEFILQQCGISQILTADEYVARCPLPVHLQVVTRPEFIDIHRLTMEVSLARQTTMQVCSVLLPGWLIERRLLKLSNHRLDALAAVLFTSGRTGEPKGVLLTHRNLVAAASSLAKSFDLTPRDRMLNGFGLNRAVGYTFGFWGPLSVGATVVTGPDNHAHEQIGQSVRSTKCTVLSVSPQTLAALSIGSQASDLASVRLIVCSGAKLDARAAAEFEDRFQIKPLPAYDCTEMAGIVATNSPDKTLENFTQVGSKPGTAGQPIAGVSCRIVDAKTFQPLPPEQNGWLQVCGANLVQGYLRQEELTKMAMRDGWFNTGDQAVMDEDGFITII